MPSNPGTVPPRRAGKKIRVDYLKESLSEFPHLLRLVDGLQRGGTQLDRFERRCLDPIRWEQCLETCLGKDQILEVAGGWQHWTWPRAAEAATNNIEDTTAFPRGDAWTISCRINLPGLKAFAAAMPGDKGEHARLLAEVCEREAVAEGNTSVLTTVGHQKNIAGNSLGRVFFPWKSFPNLSRSARAFGSPVGTKEFDMPNAVVHFALEFAQEFGLTLPCFQRYHAHKAHWRKIVMEWFSLSEHDAKKTLLQACFGFAFPSRLGGSTSVCPLLEGLAGDAIKLRSALCQKFPHILEAMQAAGRPRPETSAMAFLLFDKENQTMQAFCDLLPLHGFALAAPIFDAVLAVPTTADAADADPKQNEDALLQTFMDKTGIMMQVKSLRPTQPVDSVHGILQDILANNQGMHLDPIERVPGCFSCIGTALVNLFPEEAETVKAATSDLPEPISYQSIMELCPRFAIQPITIEQAMQLGDGARCLLHASNTWDPEVGHAYGLKLLESTVQIYTSTEQECIQTNAKLFWQRLDNTSGICVFQISIADRGEQAAKRRRKEDASEPQSCVELQLRAGVGEQEEICNSMMPTVRQSMQKEVSLEIARAILSA